MILDAQKQFWDFLVLTGWSMDKILGKIEGKRKNGMRNCIKKESKDIQAELMMEKQ